VCALMEVRVCSDGKCVCALMECVSPDGSACIALMEVLCVL
jgi:hypothetical protein